MMGISLKNMYLHFVAGLREWSSKTNTASVFRRLLSIMCLITGLVVHQHKHKHKHTRTSIDIGIDRDRIKAHDSGTDKDTDTQTQSHNCTETRICTHKLTLARMSVLRSDCMEQILTNAHRRTLQDQTGWRLQKRIKNSFRGLTRLINKISSARCAS